LLSAEKNKWIQKQVNNDYYLTAMKKDGWLKLQIGPKAKKD
jgi:hypothetical protein